MFYLVASMEVKTHKLINKDLVGEVIELGEGYSRVWLKTRNEMICDEYGLIHGGFIFGLADYAAMLAVNHENVVLAGASVKFIRPVKLNSEMIAEAKVVEVSDRSYVVSVEVFVDELKVFEGKFKCVVPEKHVLEKQ